MMTEPAGSQSEINQIVDKYSGLVYKLAYANLRNKNDADDIYQEVFLRYIRKKPEFAGEENEKAWFIRVTVNRCKSFWNSPFRRHTQPLEEDIAYQPAEGNELQALVMGLPEAYRTVVHLFYYEDMSVADISRTLNKKEATIRVQLLRARKLLRDILEGDESFAGSGV